MTLYWSEIQYQCAMYLEESTNYICNTINTNSTYECNIQQPTSFKYGLLISNLQHNYFEIEHIFINDTNFSTLFVIDAFHWNNTIVQNSIKSNEFSDYLMVKFDIENQNLSVFTDSKLDGYLYSFTRSQIISLQCIVSDIDNIIDTTCIFGSINSFLDGIYEYIFWNPLIKGVIYYNFKNKQYLIPTISSWNENKFFIWYIGLYSYCNHGSNLGNDFIFNINTCTYWVTDRITDSTMVSNNCFDIDSHDNKASKPVIFGFKRSLSQNDTSNAIIKLTLYWQYTAYQCISNTYDEYFLCNTLSITTTYQCDMSNNIKYGLQIDNNYKKNIDIDDIIIKYKNNDISDDTNVLSFNFEPTIVNGNNNKLFEFNLSNSSIVSLMSESYASICIPYINQYNSNDDIFDDICVSESMLSLDGIYKYSFWNIELHTPIYFNQEHNVYLYSIIDTIDGYTWQIGSDPLQSGAWTYCIVTINNISNHTFYVENCNEWLSWNNREWHIDSEINVRKCNAINASKWIIFGFETPSSTQTSSNAVTLTLFWDELFFQCTQIPKLSNTYYACNTNKSIKCETDKLISFNYALQVTVLEINNTQSQVVGIENVIIKVMEGNVIQNTYTFEQFCVSNNINSTNNCIIYDIITLNNKHPSNLFVFDNLNDMKSNVYNQLTPVECKSDAIISTNTPDSNLMLITIIVIICTITCVLITIVTLCILHVKTKNYNAFISNGLVVNIAIGEYDNDNITHYSADISNVDLGDIPVEKDIENINELFNMLNYKIMPQTLKLFWTENEILNYLQYDVINELFDNNTNELKYDGLIVCISCHGIENKIITSDYKTIEKNVLHRIISTTNAKTRLIPRIFIFDSCCGDLQREYIRSSNSTVCIMKSDKSKLIKNLHEQNKGTSLNDVSNGIEWTMDTKNPDYMLAIIHASNAGYQAKLDSRIGSYLLYEFTQRIKRNIEKNENKTLDTIFEEIQNELHDRGKQQPQSCFNNNTGHLRFKINKCALHPALSNTVITNSE